jgi:hypothetical protein
MKTKYLLVITLLCLFVATTLQEANSQRAVPEAKTSPDYRLSGPYTHKNLTIYLVHGNDLITGHSFLTLQEALAQKKVIVYETKDVNELAIRNLSNQDVYVQSGDIVRGGDQDRMISMDFIVPPKSGRMPIAAFCVESGRWSRRGGEMNGSFASSENSASTKELKLAAKSENSQQAVWENVTAAQDKLSRNVNATVNAVVSRSSLELSLENAKVKETAASYIQAFANLLKNKKDVIGYAFAINGQVNSADVYASSVLFAKLWPKLLKASAVEAIAELEENAKPTSVQESAVTAFLVGPDKTASEKDVTQRVRLITRENDDRIFFETRDRQKKDAWIHRNYIKK